MSTPGEIAHLVELYDPEIRLILNIGPAHLATMKTIDAIAEAKFEILRNARESDWRYSIWMTRTSALVPIATA